MWQSLFSVRCEQTGIPILHSATSTREIFVGKVEFVKHAMDNFDVECHNPIITCLQQQANRNFKEVDVKIMWNYKSWEKHGMLGTLGVIRLLIHARAQDFVLNDGLNCVCSWSSASYRFRRCEKNKKM